MIATLVRLYINRIISLNSYLSFKFVVACLAVGSQGGYKPKCRTIYETAYTTQYEQSCSTSYKTECSTSYQQHCSTEYQTEYEQKVKHIFILLKNDFFTFFQVLHQLRGAMLHQLRDFLRGEVFNHLQRGLSYFSSKSN